MYLPGRGRPLPLPDRVMPPVQDAPVVSTPFPPPAPVAPPVTTMGGITGGGPVGPPMGGGSHVPPMFSGFGPSGPGLGNVPVTPGTSIAPGLHKGIGPQPPQRTPIAPPLRGTRGRKY